MCSTTGHAEGETVFDADAVDQTAAPSTTPATPAHPRTLADVCAVLVSSLITSMLALALEAAKLVRAVFAVTQGGTESFSTYALRSQETTSCGVSSTHQAYICQYHIEINKLTRRLHLLLSLDFIFAPFKETRVPRCRTWDATCEIQKPWHMAQGS